MTMKHWYHPRPGPIALEETVVSESMMAKKLTGTQERILSPPPLWVPSVALVGLFHLRPVLPLSLAAVLLQTNRNRMGQGHKTLPHFLSWPGNRAHLRITGITRRGRFSWPGRISPYLILLICTHDHLLILIDIVSRLSYPLSSR